MTDEEELLIVRRAFPEAQALFACSPEFTLSTAERVSWFGPEVDIEPGASAAVGRSGAFGREPDDVTGRILRLTGGAGARPIFVYVVGVADLSTPLAVSRRAFLELAPLSAGTISVTVEDCG